MADENNNGNGKKKRKKSKSQRRDELKSLIVTTFVATGVATVVGYYVTKTLAKRERDAAAELQRSQLGGLAALANNNPRLAALGEGAADYSVLAALTPVAGAAANGNPGCQACATKAGLAQELELMFAD